MGERGTLRLLFSRPKCLAAASTAKVAKALKPRLARLGLSWKPWARNLGHDGAARGKGRLLIRKRIGLAVLRGPKLKKLVRDVHSKAHKRLELCLTPSALRTSSVTGTSVVELECYRRALGAMMGVSRGRSVTARFLTSPVARLDPIFASTIPRARNYVRMVWEHRVPLGSLTRAWGSCSANLLRSPRGEMSDAVSRPCGSSFAGFDGALSLSGALTPRAGSTPCSEVAPGLRSRAWLRPVCSGSGPGLPAELA